MLGSSLQFEIIVRIQPEFNKTFFEQLVIIISDFLDIQEKTSAHAGIGIKAADVKSLE